jgi:predicted SAM-dependent methyltransferase
VKLATRIAYAIFPPNVWDLIRQEWPLTQLRWANRLLPWRKAQLTEISKQRDFKLQLGCGKRAMHGWLNVDCFPGTGIHLVLDLREGLPFADGAAKLLFHEHVLEHFTYPHALEFLAECFRVLAPGGTMRVGVPDAGLYYQRFVANDRSFFDPLVALAGAVDPLDTPGKVINQMARMGGHHLFSWDYETLVQALSRTGFLEIRQCRSGESCIPELCLDDPDRAFESLYVEAMKP